MFQVILIHFLLIFTESETFQQTSQIISQSDYDLTENHFLRETKTFLFLIKSETVSNTSLVHACEPSPLPSFKGDKCSIN
jgi:hypothetical protein